MTTFLFLFLYSNRPVKIQIDYPSTERCLQEKAYIKGFVKRYNIKHYVASCNKKEEKSFEMNADPCIDPKLRHPYCDDYEDVK